MGLPNHFALGSGVPAGQADDTASSHLTQTVSPFFVVVILVEYIFTDQFDRRHVDDDDCLHANYNFTKTGLNVNNRLLR